MSSSWVRTKLVKPSGQSSDLSSDVVQDSSFCLGAGWLSGWYFVRLSGADRPSKLALVVRTVPSRRPRLSRPYRPSRRLTGPYPDRPSSDSGPDYHRRLVVLVVQVCCLPSGRQLVPSEHFGPGLSAPSRRPGRRRRRQDRAVVVPDRPGFVLVQARQTVTRVRLAGHQQAS